MGHNILQREEGALAPPEGVQPIFTDPPNRNGEIIAISSTVIVLSTIFVAIRTYTRLVVIKKRNAEDCKAQLFIHIFS
jgi:hypothetical protein